MIRVAEIRRTCDACPSQWEGATDDGRYVYIRFRWGRLSVTVANEVVWWHQAGNQFDGYMENRAMAAHLKGVLDFTGAGL